MFIKIALGFFFIAAVYLEIFWRLIVLLTAAASTCVIIASPIYAIVCADWRALPFALFALPFNMWAQKVFYDGFDDKVAFAVTEFGDRLLCRRPAT